MDSSIAQVEPLPLVPPTVMTGQSIRTPIREQTWETRSRPSAIVFVGELVGPVALDARKAQRHAAGILGATLHVVERDLDHQLGAHIHGPLVAPDLARQQLARLPFEDLVGQPLEGLAEHDEAAGARVTRAEVQVREPALAPAAAPLDPD